MLQVQFLLQSSVNNENIRDIKPPFDVTQNLLPFIIVLGALIVVLIVASIWFYYRKVRQNDTPLQDVPIVAQPPHEIALDQLNKLDNESCDMETFHIQISYIIREYIAARYQIPALELTTVALLQQMTRSQIADIYIQRIQQFLANCDRVKFTKYQPQTTEAKARMVDALWFVEETKSSED